MIVALKGNREVKITNEEDKQHYLSLGFEIIDLDASKQEAPKPSKKEAKKAKVVEEVVEEAA